MYISCIFFFIAAKQTASEAFTQITQCKMEKKHFEDKVKTMQKDVQSTSAQYKKDQANISAIEKEVDKLKVMCCKIKMF